MSVHRRQAPKAAHAVEGGGGEFVDSMIGVDHPGDNDARPCIQLCHRVRERDHPLLGKRAHQRVRGTSRIDQRTEAIENRAPARCGKFLPHRGNVLKRGMKVGCKEKDVPELLERMLQFHGRRRQVVTHGCKKICAAAFRCDAAIAVFHHRHSGTRQHQGHHRRDVESAHVVATGAHDVDRPGRPQFHAGVHCQIAKGDCQGGNFSRRFPLVGERHEERGLDRIRHFRVGQRLRGIAHFRGGEVLPGGQLGGQNSKVGHITTHSCAVWD